MDILTNCNLCHRNCHINRYKEIGFCKQTNNIRVAKATLTYYEEPCISNQNGSGTIFFSGCNLGCVFCQNEMISHDNYGKDISSSELANIMLNLQKKGAININLVTPTPHIIGIKESIIMAKKLGLNIPIIYNTGTYENVESLKILDGLVDVYLPDFKYFDNKYALKYSKVKNYFETCSQAIQEMYRQVGKCKFDKNGNIIKGVIVRHLMLPTLLNDSKQIIKYLYETYHDNIYLSIMNQYTVVKKLSYNELNHQVKENDYNNLIDYAISIGIKNAFCQLDNTSSKKFIPTFDLEGV